VFVGSDSVCAGTSVLAHQPKRRGTLNRRRFPQSQLLRASAEWSITAPHGQCFVTDSVTDTGIITIALFKTTASSSGTTFASLFGAAKRTNQ